MPFRLKVHGSELEYALRGNAGLAAWALAREGPAAAEAFAGKPVDTTEENLQSRTRGALLMALSNKFGGMLLTTGNKSEYAVGYATIYGDMCGGYAPIKDLYKTEVFELARWRNTVGGNPVIPPGVIERPPSAELRENQRDQDSLPPYDVLDAILLRYVDQEQSRADIVAAGFDADTVDKVLRLVRISEWKRHQAAPGPKVSRPHATTVWSDLSARLWDPPLEMAVTPVRPAGTAI